MGQIWPCSFVNKVLLQHGRAHHLQTNQGLHFNRRLESCQWKPHAKKKNSLSGPLPKMIADLSSSSSNQLLSLYCLLRPVWPFSRTGNADVISSSGLLPPRTQWPWPYNSDRQNQDLGDLEHITFCGPSFSGKKEYKTTFVNFSKISAIHVNILPGVLQMRGLVA